MTLSASQWRSRPARSVGELDGRPDLLDPDEHLGPQIRRDGLASAVLVHQALDRAFQAVLAQARTALVEVLAYLRAVDVVEFAVEVGVDAVEHLGTRHLVRLAAAHQASSPGSLPSADPVEDPDADRTRPRSAA